MQSSILSSFPLNIWASSVIYNIEEQLILT